MLVQKIHIRHWVAVFIFSFSTSDMGRILDALVWADAPDSIVSIVSEKVSAGQLNEGFCYSNTRERKSVVGIGKTTTGAEFLNTTVHELVHVAQDIASTDDIDPYGEELAYLVGEISSCVSDVVCEMSCPHCRH